MRGRVVIPGGSGFLGQALARHCLTMGFEVVVLSRSGSTRLGRAVRWDGRTLGDWAQELEGASAVINLAGRTVNSRYSDQHRREIMDSRVESTRVLGQAIATVSSPPPVWLNSSTATIYRHALDHPQDELTGEIGAKNLRWKFSIDVATAWEAAFFGSVTPGVRKVAMRSAIVMGPEHGGAFEVMLKLAKRGFGGRMGSGKQMVSWVHERDFCRAVTFLAFDSDLDGIVNVASPEPVPNTDLMAAIRRASGVRFGLPTSKWMLEVGAWFMQTETELILKSRWVVPTRLQGAGFEFDFPTWRQAVEELVGNR